MPGFIDVHAHGAAGHEAMDATPDALHGMARYYPGMASAPSARRPGRTAASASTPR